MPPGFTRARRSEFSFWEDPRRGSGSRKAAWLGLPFVRLRGFCVTNRAMHWWYSRGSMERMKTKPVLLALAAFAIICASLQGQTTRTVTPAPVKEKEIPVKTTPVPFKIDSPDSGAKQGIEYRNADRMTTKDREVAANAESSIAEHTRYAGLEFNQGNWTYEQVICPALPEHVFLRFMRNNGTGDVSLFTASIPRGEEGRVRIIPIQLRGYSLFSPAPINAMTISAFNHIRAEENPDHAPVSGWLGTGLCYAALAGGHPQLPPSDMHPEDLKPTAAEIGNMEIPSSGGAVISFDDVSAISRPMKWSMTFDGKGRLLKASHSSAEMLSVNAIHPRPVDQAGKRVPITQPEQIVRKTAIPPDAVTTHPIPPAPAVLRSTPVPSGDPAKHAVQPVPQM